LISRSIFDGGFRNKGLEFCPSTYGFPVKSLNGNIKFTDEVSELEVESGRTLFCDNTISETKSRNANKPGKRNLIVVMYILSIFKVFSFYRFYLLA
jgi:hypothetical protein